ncbi:MAG: hypothetical protein L3J96_06390, partial [Thermoplasmata archaeon]|nr:hypothetical protein [Thermoplasmata archaeon]
SRVGAILLGITLGVPLGIVAISGVSLLIWPLSENPLGLLGVLLPWAVLIFAIFPYSVLKYSPSQVAVTSSAIYAEYGTRSVGSGFVHDLAIAWIDSVTPRRQAGSVMAALPGLPSGKPRYLTIRTVSGVVLGLGPVSQSTEEAIRQRLGPSQTREWNPSP